jgi:hypothetical protein
MNNDTLKDMVMSSSGTTDVVYVTSVAIFTTNQKLDTTITLYATTSELLNYMKAYGILTTNSSRY